MWNDVGTVERPFGSLLGVLLSRVEMEEDPSTGQEERSHDLSRLCTTLYEIEGRDA